MNQKPPGDTARGVAKELAVATAFPECEEEEEEKANAAERAVVMVLALWLSRLGAESSPSDAR